MCNDVVNQQLDEQQPSPVRSPSCMASTLDTFFERTAAADLVSVGRWGVEVIYGMFESYAELQRH